MSRAKQVGPEMRWLIGSGPVGTMDMCSHIVRFIGNVVSEVERNGLSEKDGYAVFLIMNTVADVLQWESERTSNSRKPESEVTA
jgi:hypothetical protein